MAYLQYIDQRLCFGPSPTPLQKFTASYQGPVYIYDLASIRHRYGQMARALPGVDIYYAMKANSHPEVLRALAQAGAGVDVVSGGEIKRALENGFSPDKIVYSGVGKTRQEIQAALDLRIAQLNVESLPELQRISEIAREMACKAPVALRLNPDVDIQTHPYIATGLKDNKFGMELALLPELVELLQKNQNFLELKGLSLHLGSQMMEFAGFAEALKKLVPVFQDLQKTFPGLDVFDIGGGLGVFYETQDLKKEEELLQAYAAQALEILKPLQARLQTEPGRWLVAHSGVLLSQVQYIKTTTHKTFVIIDSGMNHLLRPSLYGAFHSVWALKENAEKMKVDVVGPICESGDFFAKEREISRVHADDFIVIADVGAYGYSMANRYNLQDLPQEIVI
jgi:diaminopimelate decarboxylase